MAAPAWQRDLLPSTEATRGGAPQPDSVSIPARKYQDVEQLSKTFGHVANVSKEFRRDTELSDLLASTSKEDTYQQHFQGWPSLLRPLSPAVLELPTMVQIRRAWASVDNSLFLSDVPLEYCGEDQAISCVGMAAPRPGVFLPAIRFVIVLCTTAEIVLLGVMTCVAAGPGGRVFLGGADGHVYELVYHAADTWRHKRISKVRLTSGLQQYLPSFVPSLLGLGAPPAVERLAVDRERHVLYALNAASGITVFDLGTCGNEPARRVAELSNVYNAAAAASRELFRGASADRKGAAVKYIAPIATSESSKLHLLAVTADGRRIYFSTWHSGAGSAALEIVAAHYSAGCLLLSESAQGGGGGAGGNSGGGGATKLLAASRNTTVPPATLNTHTGSFAATGYGGYSGYGRDVRGGAGAAAAAAGSGRAAARRRAQQRRAGGGGVVAAAAHILERNSQEQLRTFFQALEDRLRALAAFLEVAAMHKRRRLEHAAQQEDEQAARIRALVLRVAEACSLLRLLAAHNLGRLALRQLRGSAGAAADMNKLANLEPDGEALAAALISGLVNEQLDLGVAATAGGAASSGLAAAPSYFRQEDRTYYQALVSQLANLKYYEGIVTVPLAAAAARDPEGLALRPELGAACELARQRRREAYQHVLAALKAACLSSGASDAFFLDELYGFMVGLLELLCRMLVGKARFLDAALVYGALGCRRSGPGPELAVPLRARVSALQSAVLQARSAGDTALVSRLDSDARVVGFQAAITERLQGYDQRRDAPPAARLADACDAVAALGPSLHPDDLTLPLLHTAAGGSAAAVRRVYEALLLALEARRLGGPECEDIARRLDGVRAAAEALTHTDKTALQCPVHRGRVA
eukprot:XP_001694481.1 nuclear pore protein [Chlamydomonas reinhardtii]